MQAEARRIVVLGAGSIGLSFAAVFADAGFSITLVEPDPARRALAEVGLGVQREAIALAGLLRDGGGAVSVAEPGAALAGSALVIECGPEDAAAKTAIFADLLARADENCVLATASSAITISRIVPDPASQARCLVAHPVNPPAILRLIELCPAPGTAPATVDRAAEIFAAAGFAAVRLGHEIEGFVLNRLQGALLREAYRLVDEGVTDVAGIEDVVRRGLGPRWALSGPFETAELNTPGGIVAHARRMWPAYRRMGEQRGETVDWSAELLLRVERERRAMLPAEALPARAAWRTRAVALLVRVIRTLEEDA